MKLANRQAGLLTSPPPYSRCPRSTGILLCEAGTAAAVETARPWGRIIYGKKLKTAGTGDQEGVSVVGSRIVQRVICHQADGGLLRSFVAAYLRKVGWGHRVRSILDNQRVEELARINGDLDRRLDGVGNFSGLVSASGKSGGGHSFLLLL